MKGVATRIWTVGLPVTNFDKALSFYRDLLGFKVQLDGRMFNWMELGPDEPHSKIGLYEYKTGDTGRKPGE
jgi:catechol 2,3-dioxygenase-like lactoylglutathione lyase family enzyme